MADVNSLFEEYLGAGASALDNKKAQLASAATQKKGYLGGAAADVGLAPETTGADLLGITDVNEATAEASGRSDYMSDASHQRTLGQTVGDSTIDVVNGALQGAIGIGATGAGIVDAHAGTTVAKAGQDVTEFANSLQSDALNNRRRANEARNEVTQAHNFDLSKQEMEEGSSEFMSGLRRVGRDFISSITNTDSETAISGIASGIGSLLLGGVIGKGVKAAGGLAAARMAVGAAGPSRAAFAINQATKAGAMPAAIGALEGGGAYTQTVNEVMGISHDQLLQGSPDYKALIEQGWNPDDARAEVANHAGLTAAAIQAPVGVATGRLVSEFEAAPFHVPSVKTAVADVLKEGVEEGLQSGLGQVATNYGIKTSANDQQDMLEGVGRNAGEGSLYGMGTAGAVQGPALAVRAPIDLAVYTGSKVAAAAKAAAAPLIALGERREKAALDASHAESMVNLSQANAQVVENATPESRAAVEQNIAQIKDPEEAKTAADYVAKVYENIHVDHEVEAEAEPNPVIADAIRSSKDRFDVLRRVSNLVVNADLDEQTKSDASLYLAEQLQKYDSLLSTQLPEAINALEEEDPALAPLRQFEDVTTNFIQHPVLKASVAKALEIISNFNVDENNPESVATAAKIAEIAPDRAKLADVDTVLRHASEGKIQLSPESLAAIQETQNMLQTAQSLAETIDKAAPVIGRKPVNAVSNEVLLDPTEKTRAKSGAAHFAGIVEALKNGNRQLAGARLQQFMNFAQHMQNKVNALNENYALGNGSKTNDTKYQQLSLGGKFQPSITGMWVNPRVAKPVAFAQLVEAEARAITSLANRLATINPDLGVKPIGDVSLVDQLQGTPEDVVSRHRQRGADPAQPAEVTAAPDAKAEPAPAAAVEPTVEPAPKVEPKVEAKVEPTPEPKAEVKPEPVVEAAKPAETKTEAKAEPQAVEKEQKTPAPEPTPEPEVATKVEPEVEPEVEVEADPVAEPTNVAEAFPGLIAVATNWFHKAFKLPKAQISRLFQLDNPMVDVRKAIRSGAAAEKFGAKLDKFLEPKTAKAFDRLFDQMAPVYTEMKATLAYLLAQRLGSKDAPRGTFEEALLNGTDDNIAMVRRARVLNLVEQKDGKVVYNENLLQGALLAGMNWLLTGGQRSRHYDAESVAKLMNIDESDVTPDDINFFNGTLYMVDAVQTLATSVRRYWNVQSQAGVDVGHTDGIPEAIAKDMLEAFEKAGLLKLVSHDVVLAVDIDGKVTDKRSYVGIETTVPEAITEETAGFPDLIEQLVAVEPEVIDHIGEPPVPQTHQTLAGKRRKLPAQQAEAVEIESKTPHKVNTTMLELVAGLGQELVIKLFGHDNLADPQLNEQHKKSMEGFNRTIEGALRQIGSLAAQMKAKAKLLGISPADLPIYYGYEFSRVNRMHMQGKFNPQANKLMRVLVSPHAAEIDLTKGDNRNVFMLAIAQHLGVKVHRLGRNASITEVEKRIQAKYGDSIELLQQWLQEKGQLNADQVETLVKALGKKSDPVALLSLVEYVHYLSADKAGRKAFKTSLYVEADGITDGPINGLMHMATGEFTSHWVKMMAKGGLYLGSSIKTLADYIASAGEGSDRDLYEEGVVGLTEALNKVRAKDDGNSRGLVGQTRVALLYAMDKLLDGQVEFEHATADRAETLKIDRGLTKNPMTVTMYGAAQKGIANKIVHSIVTSVYAQMSTGQLDPGLVRALEVLTSRRAVLSKSKKNAGKVFVFEEPAKGQSIHPDNYVKFEFSAEQLQNLKDNVRILFVDSLDKGIQEVIQDTTIGKGKLQSAIQIQSIVAEHMFKQRVEEAIQAKAAKDPTWKTHQALSRQELDAIHAEVAAELHLLVNTGTQTFYPSATANAEIHEAAGVKDPIELSRSSRDHIGTPLMVEGPANSGVRGSPYMTIGTGDGQVIQNVITDIEHPEGAVYVFDGINVKLTSLEDDSRIINKAVLDAWLQGNPLEAVAESYNKFLGAIDIVNTIGDLPEKAQTEVFRALGPMSDITDVARLGQDLKNYALQSQARKNALARVNLSVDHMASAEAPHVETGKIELTGTFEEQAEQLNTLYNEELAKLRGEAASSEISGEEIESKPTPETTAVPETRDEHGTSEAYIVPAKDMLGHLSKFKIAANLMPLVKEALASVTEAGFQFAMGTRGQIQNLLNQQGVVHTVAEDELGLMSPKTKTMYLIQNSAETMVHELLHGATLLKVNAYYNGGGEGLSQIQVDAVQRIDEMMIEFMELDGAELEGDALQSFKEARVEIQSRLDKDERAEAVNEFMSWVLSNQDLRQLASKTKLRSTLARISARVLEALKTLLWGSKAPSVADDLLSNLEFNTRVLIADPAPNLLAGMLDTTMRHQSAQFGRSERLKDLRVKFAAKLGSFLKETPQAQRVELNSEMVDVFANADIVTDTAINHGFQMTPQEASTYRMIVAALMTETRFDGNALARVQELYSHVIKQLKLEDFMTSVETDSQDVQDVDRHYAQQKFNVVMGDFTAVKDKVNRSALLSSFLALAMTNEEFGRILSKIELPKSEKNSETTLDARLENLGVSLMDQLAVHLSGEGRNQPDIQAALDNLTDRMLADAIEQENFVQQFVTNTGNSIDKGNTWIVDAVNRLSGKAADFFERKGAEANTKTGKALLGLGEILTGLVNEDRNGALKAGAISAVNTMPLQRWMKEVFTEVVGRTEDNASIYDMIKLVRSLVQQTRQQFREHLPKQIAKQFDRKLEDSEREAMTHGLARTDIAALDGKFSLARIMDMLVNPASVSQEISKLEADLAASDPAKWPLWQPKAKELAEYMNTGKAAGVQLRNAYAVAHLFGVLPAQARKKHFPSRDQVDMLDQLISLYAYQGINDTTREVITKLVTEQPKGMDFVMSYLIGQRQVEADKTDLASRAKINGFKGHYPTEGKAGSTLIVADDTDEQRLITMGFTKVAPYKTSVAERGAPSKSYFYAPVSGKAIYNQGILQNVRSTASGVDPRTGFSIGQPMAGQIDDPIDVAAIVRNMRHNGSRDTQALLPIFDADGTVVAFERSMDPVEVARLKRNANIDEVLGMWVGRHAEELAAQGFNRELIGKLAVKYQSDVKEGKANEYVNLFSRQAQRDPIYRDAISLITPEARQMIAGNFDEGEFWVRMDMVNDAIGYRSASLGDVWTGTSRLHPEIQKNARALAIGVFGQDAYKKVVQAEKIVQTVISDARVTIVVKSVVVPVANLVSNIYHLSARGVPIQHIMKGFPKKTAEIDLFIKGRLRRLELEGLEKAAQGRGDQASLGRIQTELQAIRDANRRLTIWPLLAVGEFSAISDAAISHEEIDLAEGRLSEYIEQLTNKLPDELKTVGRYGVVAKDTALFKGMQRAVEYGDFLAKAVLYDDLVIRQKKSPEYALARISEEFVNYDRLPGRGRGYLENMGLMWFWHFKLRAIKIAASTIRYNPLHLLLSSLVPVPDVFGAVGTPVTDNALSVIGAGKAGWSLGVGQAIHAHALNPWVNLFT
jgi:hypothetical protein